MRGVTKAELQTVSSRRAARPLDLIVLRASMIWPALLTRSSTCSHILRLELSVTPRTFSDCTLVTPGMAGGIREADSQFLNNYFTGLAWVKF